MEMGAVSTQPGDDREQRTNGGDKRAELPLRRGEQRARLLQGHRQPFVLHGPSHRAGGVGGAGQRKLRVSR